MVGLGRLVGPRAFGFLEDVAGGGAAVDQADGTLKGDPARSYSVSPWAAVTASRTKGIETLLQVVPMLARTVSPNPRPAHDPSRLSLVRGNVVLSSSCSLSDSNPNHGSLDNSLSVSGLIHRSRGNRAKSLSNETSVAPWESASAARCASLVKLPAAPVSASKPRSSRMCSSASWTMRTLGRASHRSTRSQACPASSGLGKIDGRVLRRRNPRITLHANPTGSSRPNAASQQDRAFS